MAKEAREIVAHHEQELRKQAEEVGVDNRTRLDALRLVRTAINQAERLGALTRSVPQLRALQFGKVTRIPPEEKIRAVLGFDEEQVAQEPDEITPDTRAYVGSLTHTDDDGRIIPIFERLIGVEHIFSADGTRIHTWNLEVGGRTIQDWIGALDDSPIRRISIAARDILESPGFAATLRSQRETVRVALIKGYDFGSSETVTTQQRQAQLESLGLESCLPEIAPALGIVDKWQDSQDIPTRYDGRYINAKYWVAMTPIPNGEGKPVVFGLERGWLGIDQFEPNRMWRPLDRWVVAFRQPEPAKSLIS